MARLDRYRIGIPRELSEIHTQPWLSEGSLTCDQYHQNDLKLAFSIYDPDLKLAFSIYDPDHKLAFSIYDPDLKLAFSIYDCIVLLYYEALY